MTTLGLELPRPPHRDDLTLRRDEGLYWQARDGLIVRVAAPETDAAERERAQRELWQLSCREALDATRGR